MQKTAAAVQLLIRKSESGKGDISVLGTGQLFSLVIFRDSVNCCLSLASVDSGVYMETFELVHVADICIYVCTRIYV